MLLRGVRGVGRRLLSSQPALGAKQDVGSLSKRVDLRGKVVLLRSGDDDRYSNPRAPARAANNLVEPDDGASLLADLNTPMTKGDGPPQITDDTRIVQAVPTVQLLTEAGARVVLC